MKSYAPTTGRAYRGKLCVRVLFLRHAVKDPAFTIQSHPGNDLEFFSSSIQRQGATTTSKADAENHSIYFFYRDAENI